MMPPSPIAPRKYGFTLIELSIVLVIIGLIIGGILVGQEMIKASEIRSQVSQIQKFDQATKAFKLKYNTLPGDVINPPALGLAYDCNPPNHGNGNGILEDANGVYPPGDTNCESLYFFVHLQQVSLIGDLLPFTGSSANSCYGNSQYSQTVGCQFPLGKIGRGGFLAYTDASLNLGYFFGMNNFNPLLFNPVSLVTHTANGPVLSTMEAYQLDAKMDDGKPLSGNIRSIIRPRLADTVANNCITTVVANTYNLPRTGLSCSLWIRSQ